MLDIKFVRENPDAVKENIMVCFIFDSDEDIGKTTGIRATVQGSIRSGSG